MSIGKLALGVAVAGGVIWALTGTASASGAKKKTKAGQGKDVIPAPAPDPTFNPDAWDGDLPVPGADDVSGDLVTNWGLTPTSLRPLLMLGEQTSGIRGAGRVLSIIARRESRWVYTAHNDSAKEVKATTNAYNNVKATRPPLKYGAKSAAFGSGGLFGLSAPYYLWTGVNELKAKAPLLDADPETVFFPRLAVFGALCYMERVLANYDVRDIPDIKAGWASPSLLGKSRGNATYLAVRERFAEDVQESEIELVGPTIPSVEVMIQDAKNKWPGVQAVFDAIVGTIPVRTVPHANA